ncbi:MULTISPECIES: Tol-Pal system beta propeller repeat protein TolB [unclassified Phenylobacterium]|uniref:Tol-Pal system beta propeller repeat protein TolB n=1 Tax=unclassified Phenylobacterium TaxID=2640670 RepID=UPI0022B2BD68|nr:Tol-Pal system beta propeller repeat protein TolB [Phenylobacterium sp. NIBR 498073]MBS0492246.1 Tol-Pal system protein TolB [Pseudomonadota bacterium]WGU39782.1 Tol-Pal system beta propeller repeat protein TolB [Phenylobacterium sp. NIBR 498073]
MRLKTLALAVVAALISSAALTVPARAQIEVDVNRGDIKPLPIAIPAFGGQQGAEIAQVITGNLERSGLFAPIPPAAHIEKTLDVNVQPRFPDWKVLNAQALVNGQVTVEGGRLTVNFRLWDVYSEQQLLGLQFTSTPDNWRRVAHKISDAVYERLTGEKGYFDTRVVFVSESGDRLNRRKQLAIMDQDGANPSYLTDGSYIVMTPRFSSTSQEITYMALRPEGSSIYLFNLESGRRETLGNFPGMVFAPRFSPDGGRVAFSVERAGNTDIYVMDLRSRSTNRLTSDPSIETSPSFSPDGSRIVYNSDRGGSAQLYIMDTSGGGARRISFGSGRYTTPVWSPTGEYIAFTKQAGGQFHIGIMKPDGSDERILTTSYLDEGPTWAPNGRVLMFSRETPGGAPRLWTVDVTGRIERAAPYPGSGSDPAWSPLLN